ncbi:MAG TPA: ATP-binding protein [Bacteroidales bacterium]|nr:ATP-binding protein [Bacteroidales bacterium]
MLKKFPILSLTGPRQSGKTTLLRNEFPEYKYYNLERTDMRDIITSDPAGFLNNAGEKIILDEIQNLPDLFSYIQVLSDERGNNGQYILSGSQSFVLNSKISQSLAGRVSMNNLFPFDISELSITDNNIPGIIVNGFYPRLYDQNILPEDFYPSYIQTYIERDIRNLRPVENLQTFSRFLSLCAGRAGQIVNLSSLANDTGVSVNTIKAWLSLLESSFIIFLLQPWHVNISKRLIKSPKLYFYDTGIVCSLLRISNPDVLYNHYLYGFLFENLVISEIIKSFFHNGIRPEIYYWRESNGAETDCLIQNGNDIIACEIKSGETFSNDFLKNLNVFSKSYPGYNIEKNLIYNGQSGGKIKDANLLSWNDTVDFIKNIHNKSTH